MKGFIKDHRQELKSDIWLMPPMYHRVWQYLKYMVNHEPAKVPMKDGSFFPVGKGQHLTSVRSIAQAVGYYEGLKWKEPNPKTISTILAWLEKQQMISIDRGKGNRQYTLITLSNWDVYQSKENEGNRKETVDGEGRKQSADINKNDKNNKEVYIVFEHWNEKKITRHKELTQARKSKINARLQTHGLKEIKQAIDNYSVVLNSELYYYTHKFKLERFMDSSVLDDFLSENNPFEKFKRNKISNLKNDEQNKAKEQFEHKLELQRRNQDRNEPGLLFSENW